MSTPAVVLVDDDDPCLPSYRQIPLPTGWSLEVGPRAGLSQLYNRAYSWRRDEAWYGILCDDVIPETECFDRRLIAIAGEDGMAVPAGGHEPGGAPHFVLGRGLPERTGWLSLPGLKRLYIDTVWVDIAMDLRVLRRVPDVILRHHHFSNGLALKDRTYHKPQAAADKAVYEAWRST